jgi:transcriptional regulator with XRE-family HTH domain
MLMINERLALNTDNEEIADRFRELRSQSGISQKDFASSIGLSHTVIAEIERGGREPSRKVMIALADKYKVSLDWLLLGIGSMYHNQGEDKRSATDPDEVEVLKKEIAEMEIKIRKLEAENKEVTQELLDRMRQLVEVQRRQLGNA